MLNAPEARQSPDFPDYDGNGGQACQACNAKDEPAEIGRAREEILNKCGYGEAGP